MHPEHSKWKIFLKNRENTPDSLSLTDIVFQANNEYEFSSMILDNIFIERQLGEGSFGKVFLIRSKFQNSEGKYFALKARSKNKKEMNQYVSLFKSHKEYYENCLNEKDILILANRSDYVSKLFLTFQNEVKTFFSFFLLKNYLNS